MRPFDPRLLRYAKATRGLLIMLGLLSFAQVVLAISTAALLASAVTGVFEESKDLAALTGVLAGLLLVAVLRPVVAYLQESLSARTSVRVKAELSGQVVSQVARLGPAWLIAGRRSRLVLLLTSGLDALDEYFARYLPQLVASAIVPVSVVVALAWADPLSAVIVAVTLPLIPLFMVLIGWRTQAEQRRQWDALQTMGGHFLDVLRGLVTLKIFGRSRGQTRAIGEVSERYRLRTMKVLRISFLSSFALELLATLSVAIVAVEVGLRLVDGSMTLKTGLFVLVLAPEAYLPLRQVGVHYHASQAGLAAAEEVFEILEAPDPGRPSSSVDLRLEPMVVDEVRVQHPDRGAASLSTSFEVSPGEIVALLGPSGGGKSTAVGVLLGTVEPTSGQVRVGACDAPATWRDQIAWLPQHPGFVRGTIADNVRVVAPGATDREVAEALQRAGADFVDQLPEGINARLGEQGAGVSVGQRQRIALARVFVRPTPVAVLDEPTAGLDGATERAVVSAIAAMRADRTVVLVAHRPALAAVADRTVVIGPRRRGVPVNSDLGHVRWLLALARPQRGRLVSAVLLASAAAAASVALMGTAAYLISRASQQPPILTLTVAIVAVRFFGISRAVARYSERLVGHDAAFRVASDLRVAVFESVEPRVPVRLDDDSADQGSGDVLTRFALDVDTLTDAYLRVFPPYGVAAVVGTGSVVAMALIDPWVGLALAAGLLVSAFVATRVVTRVIHRSHATLARRRTAYADQVLELIEVLPETWVSDTCAPAIERVGRQRHGLMRAELRVARGAGAGQAFGVLVAGVTVLTCLVLGASAVGSGALDGVLLAVLVLTPLAAFDLTTPLPDAARRWGAVAAATERIRELLDTTASGAVAPASAALPGAVVSAASSPSVLLRRATVPWPGASAPTLQGVDLEVAPGGRVAVVGPSGSGKSTLAMALAGFLPVGPGTLSVGGIDIDTLGGDRWHATVGLLEQRPYLFDTTVAENLLIADPTASRSAIDQVLQRVGLTAWVDALPRGLDTSVGEHGRQLSGGQRQRLGLARLLLAHHPVVVLDEPDEHLDAYAADALMHDLLSASRGRTTVVISHRLLPLSGVDEIVVLEDGRVSEAGPHGGLMARGGWYARTWMREQELAAAIDAAGRR